MTIAYAMGKGLYLNITNRCPCRCDFCIRSKVDALGTADSLWLDHEPTMAEIEAELAKIDWRLYEEVIFCGYGEPLSRYQEVVAICDKIHEQTEIPIRINTNGLANLIHKVQVIDALVGKVDAISVSLNAPNAKRYVEICHPAFGEQSFQAMLDFTKYAKDKISAVTMSVVDVLAPEEIEACRAIAEEIGVGFRVRACF